MTVAHCAASYLTLKIHPIYVPERSTDTSTWTRIAKRHYYHALPSFKVDINKFARLQVMNTVSSLVLSSRACGWTPNLLTKREPCWLLEVDRTQSSSSLLTSSSISVGFSYIFKQQSSWLKLQISSPEKYLIPNSSLRAYQSGRWYEVQFEDFLRRNIEGSHSWVRQRIPTLAHCPFLTLMT